MPQDKKQEFTNPYKDQEFTNPFTHQQTPEEIVSEGVKSGLQQFAQLPGVHQTVSTLSPVLDFLSRPSHASARFADALADESKGVLDAMGEAWDELVGTEASGRRTNITYSDFIQRRFPDYAISKPKAAAMLGFVGDIALDPTSYLGVGLAKDGLTIGGRVLTKAAEEGLVETLAKASRKVFVGADGTLELVESLPKAAAKAEKAEERLLRQVDLRAKKPSKAIGDEGQYFTRQISTINKRANIEEQLTNQGYFDAVRNKADEISKFFDELVGSPNVDVAETIAKSETLKDLKRVARNRLPDEMFVDEVKERMYQRINYLANLDPKYANQIFEPSGVYLKYGLPFGKQRDLVRLVGLEGLTNRVKAISSYMEGIPVLKTIPKVYNQLGETFSRNFGLPKEYIQFRDELENELGYLTDDMIRNTKKLFKQFPKVEDREAIGEAMHWIDSETRKVEAIRAKSSDPDFRSLTDGEAAQIAQEGMDRFGLSLEAKGLVGQMMQSYKEAALLEKRAGLLKSNLLNYSPRGYEVIENPDEMSLITRGKVSPVPQPYLSSSHSRKFDTLEEAIQAGFQPELDAALLYSHRMLSSQRALAIQHFKDSVTELFGAYNPKSRIAHTGILPTTILSKNLPERVVADMKMIGEAIYPSGTNPTIRNYIRVFDKLQGLFKRGATTVRPSFAPKQLISNTFQAAMLQGIKAFKALDPRVAADAAIMLLTKGRPLDELPPFISRWFTENLRGNNGLDAVLASRGVLARHFGEEVANDVASKIKIKTNLGEEISGTEALQLARENGVFRGFDSTGEAFSQKLISELSKDENSYKNVVGVLGKVWNHAAMVEDYGRMMMFTNGLRMGYSAKDAAKLVNKALFDYSRGLSKIEKDIIRRILPFYSFQRFAIPYVLKNTLARPGNFSTIDKLMKTTEKLLVSGEELNEGERHIFNEKGNNYLLEQPTLLTGFDDKGKATLNILNNLTPYDVINLLVYDKEGNIDIGRTSEKTFGAALTPFIKVPLEGIIHMINGEGRDFFTGSTIEKAAKFGDVRGSIGKIIPNWAKPLMGWEEATNKVTGKTSVYVNPFLSYYAMQFVPALRDIVKAQEDTQYDSLMGPLQAAMNLIYESGSPVKHKDVDLKEMGIRSLMSKDKDIKEIEKAWTAAIIEGRDSKAEDDRQKLLRFVKILGENAKARAGFNIRGEGLRPSLNPNLPIEVPENPVQETPNYK